MDDPFAGIYGGTTDTEDPNDPFKGIYSLARRNHNPGNLKDSSGNFQKFATDEEGFNALKADIIAKQTGQTKTGLTGDSSIRSFFDTYAPITDSNNPSAYTKFVSKNLGVDTTAAIKNLDPHKLATVIAQYEDGDYWKSIKGKFEQAPTEQKPQAQGDPFAGIYQPEAPLVTPGPMPESHLGGLWNKWPLVSYKEGVETALNLASNDINSGYGLVKGLLKFGADIAPVAGIVNPRTATPAIESLFAGGTQAAKGLGPQGLAEMTWDFINKLVVDPLKLMNDAQNAKVVDRMPTFAKWLGIDESNLMSDQDRLKMSVDVANTALAVKAAGIIGKALPLSGAAGKVANLRAVLNIPEDIGSKEMMFKYIPDALSKMDINAQADLATQVAKAPFDILKEAAPHSFAAGVTFSVAQRHFSEDEIVPQAFQYGIAAVIMGATAAKLQDIGGISARASTTKLGQALGFERYGRDNQIIQKLAGNQMAETMAQTFESGADAVDIWSRINTGEVSVAKAYQDYYDKSASGILKREDGTPVKVYHGTGTTFDKPDVNLSDNGPGYYASTKPEFANIFADIGSDIPGKAPQVRFNTISSSAKILDVADIYDITKAAGYDAIRVRGSSLSDKGDIYRILNPDILKSPFEQAKPQVLRGVPESMIKGHENVYERPDGLYDALIVAKNDPSISQDAQAHFRMSGMIPGQKLTYQGGDYAFDGVINSKRSRIIDPRTGRKMVVANADLISDHNVTIPNVDRVQAKDFLEKAQAELTPTDRMILDANKASVSTILNAEGGNVAETLLANGYYFEEAGGKYKIKSLSKGADVQSFETLDGVRKFASERANAPPPEEIMKQVQEQFVSDIGTLRGAGVGSLNTGQRGEVTWYGKKMDAFRVSLGSWLTPLESKFGALGRRTGIDLTAQKVKLNDAGKAMMAFAAPYNRRFALALAPIMEAGADMQLVFRNYMNARSRIEIETRGLHGKDPMTPIEFTTSKKLQNFTSDDRVVAVRFLSEKAHLDSKLKEGKETQDTYQKKLEAILTTINNGAEISPTQVSAAQVMEPYWGKQSVNIAKVNAHADAIENNTPDRATFAKNNNIPTHQVRALETWGVIMREFAQKLGMDEGDLIESYFPVIKKYMGGNVNNIEFLERSGFVPPNKGKWIHDMARVGVITPDMQIMDMTQVTSKYIHRALQAQFIDPAIKEFRTTINDRVKEITESLGGKDVVDQAEISKTVSGLNNLVDNLEDMASRHMSVEDKLAEAHVSKYLARVSGTAEAHSTDYVNAWNRWVEFKTQGFKPIAGIRDGTTAALAYGYLFGSARMGSFIKMLPEAVRYAEKMQNSGMTASLEMTRLANPNVDRTLNNSILKQIQEVGFQASLQPWVYRVANAMAYLETTKTLGDNLGKLMRKEITPEKFRVNVGLDMYEAGIEGEFNKLLNSGAGGAEKAIDFLARRSGEMTVGQYGLLNNPKLYQIKLGKMFGQYGAWPLWMIQQVSRGLETKSGADKAGGMINTGIAKRLAFLTATSGAAYGLSKASGINLNNWTLSPFNMFFKGSPLWQQYGNFVDATNNGSPTQGYGQSGLINGLEYIANPIPNQFMSILEAGNRYSAGDPLWIVGAKLLANPVDTKMYKRPDWNLFDLLKE
jgi:hypothetical protein